MNFFSLVLELFFAIFLTVSEQRFLLKMSDSEGSSAGSPRYNDLTIFANLSIVYYKRLHEICTYMEPLATLPLDVSAPDWRPFYVSGFFDLDQIHKIIFYL
jgi:hypothetical protein